MAGRTCRSSSSNAQRDGDPMPHANSVAIEAMPASYVNVPNCERIVASGTRIRVGSNTIGARLPLEPVRDIVGYFDRQGSVDQHKLRRNSYDVINLLSQAGSS